MTADERFSAIPEPVPEGEFEGFFSEIITGPVTDWATDFSHLEPEWSADPYPIQDDLRQRCPIAHTDRFGGAWLPTRYEDVAAIASDPPFHHDARKLLLPPFTRNAVARQEPATRAFCHSLIDALEGREVVDAARD